MIHPLKTMNVCAKFHVSQILVEVFQSGPKWLTNLKQSLPLPKPCHCSVAKNVTVVLSINESVNEQLKISFRVHVVLRNLKPHFF